MKRSQISQKIIKIMELAYMINPIATDRDETGNKPTVFVEFMGHVAKFRVRIYSNGWDTNEPFCNADKFWSVYVDDDNIEKKLDEIIIELIKLMPEIDYNNVKEIPYNKNIKERAKWK